MLFLVDTGVLLRLFIREDVQHRELRQMVHELKAGGHHLVTGIQNVAEFWNVLTRPATARGGYGLSVEIAAWRTRRLERLFRVIHDTPETYAEWKRLVTTHRVLGVQVHDARLAALMSNYSISNLVTLNEADFRRYPHVTPLSPQGAIMVARGSAAGS